MGKETKLLPELCF